MMSLQTGHIMHILSSLNSQRMQLSVLSKEVLLYPFKKNQLNGIELAMDW